MMAATRSVVNCSKAACPALRMNRRRVISGLRVDVEQVPRLPTFPARWVLEDPRKRPYLVFWVSDDGDRCHGIQMAPTGQPDSVMVTFDDGGPQRLTILRRSLPRGTGTALFYRCSWCHKPRRYLYLLTLSGTKLVGRERRIVSAGDRSPGGPCPIDDADARPRVEPGTQRGQGGIARCRTKLSEPQCRPEAAAHACRASPPVYLALIPAFA